MKVNKQHKRGRNSGYNRRLGKSPGVSSQPEQSLANRLSVRMIVPRETLFRNLKGFVEPRILEF